MNEPRRRRIGAIAVVATFGLVMAACGADPVPSAEPGQPETVELPEVVDRATPERSPAPERSPQPRSVDRPTDRPGQQELDQPAIWPAPSVVFATPEEAAADFVASVLISDGDPLLGEFQQGDARSGEIAVLFAGETGDLDPPIESGLLLLRQIGPTDGWYVIGATSDGVVLDTPTTSSEVAAGPVTVAGQGRGFEGTLVVRAFAPGDADAELDVQIGSGGVMGDLEPFSVELDLSAATAGDVVVILVRGDTGLDTDPSTFAAIPVVVSATPTETLPPTK